MKKKKNYAQKSPLQRAEETASKMHTRFAIAIVMVIAVMVVALIVLASQTQVPQIARAAGVVIPKGSYTRLESVEGGVVYAVHTSDGDLVQAGDILLEVRNPSLKREEAQLSDSLTYALDRYANIGAIVTGLDLPIEQRQAVLADLRSRGLSHAATRLELFFNGQEIQRKTIEQKRKTTETLATALSLAQERVKRQALVIQAKRSLFSNGLITQNDVQTTQSQFDDARARDSDIRVRWVEAEESLVAAEADNENQKLILLEELLADQSELESEIQSLGSDIDIVKERIARQQIRAPQSGRIQFTSPISLGELIEPGQIVFEISPAEQTLVVEVKVSNTDYGHVELGQQLSVSFDNFDARRYGKVNGTVSSLSPVPLIDEMTGETYFRTNIDLSQSFIGDGQFRRQILAGFTGIAEMQTGESSLLSYLMRPIERTLTTAFTER